MAGRIFLAQPYYSHRAVFASVSECFFSFDFETWLVNAPVISVSADKDSDFPFGAQTLLVG